MSNGHTEHDTPSSPDSTMDDNVTIPEEEFPKWYIRKYGRDFHNFSSPYFLPADSEEMERLNIQHGMLKDLLDVNTFGPLGGYLLDASSRQKRVVDLGSGSGIWVEEMASEFPHVKFIGLDLVPTATQYPPTNAQFECYDFLADRGLQLRDASIDIIHARCIISGIADYARLAQESLRVLYPRGCFLSAELDFRPEVMSVPNGSVPIPATREVIRRMMSIVPHALDPPSIPLVLETEGFVEVSSSVVMIPIGAWGDTEQMRLVGTRAQESMLRLIHALRPALLEKREATGEAIDIDDLLTRAQREIATQTVGVSMPYHMVHARRP
ncbi:hypothetical protein FRB97_002443 [Tulasnella sp. 331]|nr:hypothetical protein FRB97_002443 [Tulasnella sp. 331]KAG8885067.1 hypothetical protein FRB98_002026 [Tulasnella sp. 332]